jgi:hypothetical protein
MDIKDAAETANSIVTSVAIIIGGTWAYLKFIRGRTFAYRAELEISSSFESSPNCPYLIVTIKLTNVGLSKIPLNRNMKVVRLLGAKRPGGKRFSAAEWEPIETVPILDQHDWLEAQETIIDTILFNAPRSSRNDSQYKIYEVEGIVGAHRSRISGSGTRWQSRTIVPLPPDGIHVGAVSDKTSLEKPNRNSSEGH